MSDEKDANGLCAAIDTIVETAKAALKSGAVAENEREELQFALARFERSTGELSRHLPDSSKLELLSVITGAFTIGMTAAVSDSVVASTKREQAAIGRKAREAAMATDPKGAALVDAIRAEIGGRPPDKITWKFANSIRDQINSRLRAKGFEGVSADTIRRRAAKIMDKSPRS
jgi:hypothetical protein